MPRVQESFSFSEQSPSNFAPAAASSDFVATLLRDLREAVGTVADANAAAATVAFVVQADGSLGRVRIVRSSGSRVFDAAVLEACAHVHAIGFPREVIGRDYELVFRPTTPNAR